MYPKANIIGQNFVDNEGRKFVVTEETGRNKFNERLYSVKYLETGYVNKNRRLGDIKRGEVKDHYAPTVAGVGFIGDMFVRNERCIERKIYDIWKNMLYRCYKETCQSYKYYGARGVTVCERWFNFENFFNDAINLPGFNENEIMAKQIELDKDIINRADKQYNKENCQWVSVFENRKEGADHRWNQARQKQQQGVTTIP